MLHKGNNLNAGEVHLNLPALRDALGAGVRLAREAMNDEQRAIEGYLEESVRLERAENEQERETGRRPRNPRSAYSARSNAHTHLDYLRSAASDYCLLVEEWFMVTEAIYREETIIHKEVSEKKS